MCTWFHLSIEDDFIFHAYNFVTFCIKCTILCAGCDCWTYNFDDFIFQSKAISSFMHTMQFCYRSHLIHNFVYGELYIHFCYWSIKMHNFVYGLQLTIPNERFAPHLWFKTASHTIFEKLCPGLIKLVKFLLLRHSWTWSTDSIARELPRCTLH